MVGADDYAAPKLNADDHVTVSADDGHSYYLEPSARMINVRDVHFVATQSYSTIIFL